MTDIEKRMLQNQALILDALGDLLRLNGGILPGRLFKASGETREFVEGRAPAMLKGDQKSEAS